MSKELIGPQRRIESQPFTMRGMALLALFKWNRSSLPADIVTLLERFGRHEIDPINSADDGSSVWSATQQPLLRLSQENPEQLVDLLAEVAVPLGGWVVYGADRTVVNLVGTDPPYGSWLPILDASIAFLRTNFVPPMRVAGYQWDRFVSTGGTANTWLELRPTPARGSVTIRPLAAGEERVVIKMGPEPDANLTVVTQVGAEFVALIDAKWSDEDPTRSRSEFKRAASLHDLFADLGWSVQVWDWADPEMEPFFPAPKARI